MTPTPPAPTASAAGPTGSRRCSRGRPATSATPTSRSVGGSCRPILAEQVPARPGTRPGPGHPLRRRQRHPAPEDRRRRAHGGLRRGGRQACRHRRPPPAVHRLRPRLRPAVPTPARPGRGLQRAGPRDRRPCTARRSSTTGGCGSTATPGSGTSTACTCRAQGHQPDGHRGAGHPWRRARPAATRSARSRRRSTGAPSAAPTWPGPARTSRRGCSGGCAGTSSGDGLSPKYPTFSVPVV